MYKKKVVAFGYHSKYLIYITGGAGKGQEEWRDMKLTSIFLQSRLW